MPGGVNLAVGWVSRPVRDGFGKPSYVIHFIAEVI